MAEIPSTQSKRVNHDLIVTSLNAPYISAILGPRRVGKSTFVDQFRAEHPNYHWIKFNMDILSERQLLASGALRSEIEKRALQKIGTGSKLWVTIDESQKCPELFEQIKVIYDEFKDQDRVKFILTGSASLDLHNLSAESLAGRIELLNLREFTLKEHVMLEHKITMNNPSLLETIATQGDIQACTEAATPYQTLLEQAFESQMIYGGLPEVILSPTEDERLRYMDHYIQTYLEKDVRNVADIANLDLYQKLLDILSEHTGSLRDDTRLLEALSCARNTLIKYRHYLIATKIYHEVYPIMNDAKKRLIKSPKGYVRNNGIVSILTGLDSTQLLTTSGKIGHRMENWFLKELQVWLDRQVRRHRIYFWRTSSDAEVDFIVEQKPWLIPFEVAYRNRIDSAKLKNLARFMTIYAKKCKTGVLIYNGPYEYKKDLNIHCIPAWMVS